MGIPLGLFTDLTPTLQKMGLLVEISGDAPLQQLLKMLNQRQSGSDHGRCSGNQLEAAQIGLADKIRLAGNTNSLWPVALASTPLIQNTQNY